MLPRPLILMTHEVEKRVYIHCIYENTPGARPVAGGGVRGLSGMMLRTPNLHGACWGQPPPPRPRAIEHPTARSLGTDRESDDTRRPRPPAARSTKSTHTQSHRRAQVEPQTTVHMDDGGLTAGRRSADRETVTPPPRNHARTSGHT